MIALGLVLAHALTICIDPGHPSESGRGTRGRHSTEIGVAWNVANLLAAKLRTEGYTVVMTKRSMGEFVTNRRRAEIANLAHADLFLRLHCDAARASGFAVHYPDRRGRAPDGTRGPAPSVIKRSSQAARAFHAAFARLLAGKLADRGLMGDNRTAIGARQGALTGSIYSHVPAVLVEMVVLTNPHDESFVTSEGGRRALVEALAAGVNAATKGARDSGYHPASGAHPRSRIHGPRARARLQPITVS